MMHEEYMLKHSHPKDMFTVNDDKKLKSIINSMDSLDWNLIAEKMGNRNARQCKDRWTKYLSPNVNRLPFTALEDMLLFEKYKELGPHWVLISKFFNNRSDTSIKSRFMQLKRHNLVPEELLETNFKRYHNTPKRVSPAQNTSPTQNASQSGMDLIVSNQQQNQQNSNIQASNNNDAEDSFGFDTFYGDIAIDDIPADLFIDDFCF